MEGKQLVCLQIHNDYQIPGGETKTAHLIADFLERNGIKVIRYYKTNMEYAEEHGVFQKICSGVRSLYNPQTTKELNDIIDKEKIDFALVHNVVSVISNAAYKVLIKRGIPIIKYLQNYNLVCLNGALDHGDDCRKCQDNNMVGVRCKCYKESTVYSLTKCFIKRDMDKHILSYISAFMPNSEFVMKKHVERGIDEKKMHVMYNYVSLPRIQYDGRRDYYLYYGRISGEKGVLTTISVFEKMQDKKLIIMGSGLLADQVSRITENNNNIDYIGSREGQELLEYVAKAKAVIVPSEWDEPLPRTILEAYSQGTPAIGSDRGGIPEMIIEKKTGYVFHSGEPEELEKCIDTLENLSGDEYKNMRQNCLDMVSAHYSEQAYFDRFIDCIRTL